MPINILLINPYVTDFKLYDEWMHPAGLYFLKDILESNGHNVSYFNCLGHNATRSRKYGTGDFNSTEISKPDLYSSIKRKYKLYGRPVAELKEFLENTPEFNLVCVGSMMTYWARGVIETIHIIRESRPEIPVIIGGIAAQLMPYYFKNHIENCITGNLQSAEISSLLQIKNLPDPSFIRGFRSLSAPVPHAPVVLSLGCPMRCTYCASSILQPSFRYRSLDIVVKEIEHMIKNFGVRDFAFYDDALLYKPEIVLIPFLKIIIERKYSVRFHTPNGLHLRFLNESILELMLKAGFTTLRFGYESGDFKYKQDTSGKIDQTELLKKIKLVKDNCSKQQDTGIYVMGGLRDQKPEQMIEEMDFLGSLGIKVKPVFVSPVPGTTLYQYYLKQFPLLSQDPLWHNDSFFITRLPGWNSEAVEAVRVKAKMINSRL